MHGIAGIFRCLQDAHLLQRETALVEDAEHGVAMDDQVGDVGDGRRIGLLLARTGNEGHEVAKRLRVVEQLAQLHADPGWIEDTHVE